MSTTANQYLIWATSGAVSPTVWTAPAKAKPRTRRTKAPAPAPGTLPFRTGLELTFLAPANARRATRLLARFQRHIRAYSGTAKWPSTIDLEDKYALAGLEGTWSPFDPGSRQTIEVPSPILTTKAEVEHYYTYVESFAKANRMVPRSQYCLGGGGHIHLSKPTGKWTFDEVLSVYLALYRNPFISWVFNDPEDDINAASMPPTVLMQALINPGEMTRLALNKDWAANYKRETNTIELRFFQNPLNLAEQMLHLDFAQAFVKWAVRTKPRDWITRESNPLHRFARREALDSCKTQFKCLCCYNLGIQTDPYQPFIIRNLTRRFEGGFDLV